MARTFGRLIIVPFAFLLAAMTAGMLLFVLGQERIVQVLGGQNVTVDGVFGAGEVMVRVAIATFSVQTLLPVLLLIVFGEVSHLRSPIYYIVGGGAAVGVIPLLARLGQTGLPEAASLWQIFATAGFAGGFVYWLLAGRRA